MGSIVEKGSRHRKPFQKNLYRISGEYFTLQQICDRLGESAVYVDYRMRTLRQLPGAITWERLQRFGGSATA